MCSVSADGKSSFEVISSSERKRAIFSSAELPTERVNVSRAMLKGEVCKASNKADVFNFFLRRERGLCVLQYVGLNTPDGIECVRCTAAHY